MTASFEPDKYLVFIVGETTHDTPLPQALPKTELVVAGVHYQPFDYDGPVDTDHHRSTVVRFARNGADGAPIISDATTRVEVVITSAWDPDVTPRFAEWNLPIEYPARG